jgi:hypothetical protein
MSRFYVVHASGAVSPSNDAPLWPMNFVVTVTDDEGNAAADPKFEVWSGQNQGLINVTAIKQPAPAKWFALQHWVDFSGSTPVPQQFLYVIRAFNHLTNGGVIEGQTTVLVTWLTIRRKASRHARPTRGRSRRHRRDHCVDPSRHPRGST